MQALLCQIERDVQDFYNNSRLLTIVERTPIIVEKEYSYDKVSVRITFTRKWGGAIECCGVGFYGSDRVIGNSNFYETIPLVTLKHILEKDKYVTMTGSYSKIGEISFSHNTTESLCTLVLNGYNTDSQ
jgi:hypothetical protein